MSPTLSSLLRTGLIGLILLITPLAQAETIEPAKADTIPTQNQSAPYKHYSIPLFYYQNTPELNILENITLYDWRHVPGAYKCSYVGLHKIILGQVKRKVQHQAEDNLWDEWNQGGVDQQEFDARMCAINSSFNPYGNWWERSWLHSLPPEKGGAPYEVTADNIGWEIQLPHEFPVLGWFKQQFDKLGDIWIKTEYEFDDSRINSSKKTEDDKETGPLKFKGANLGFERSWRWFEGNSYHFRFKPIVKFASSEKSTFIDEFTLKVQVDLFSKDYRRIHFATINFSARHTIAENNTYFGIFIEVFSL